jgi:beta-lactamase class A
MYTAPRISCSLSVALVLLVAPSARADQTSRMTQLLGSDGTTGFYNKQVGGAVVGKLRETFVYNPDSSIKIVVAVGLLRRVDANLAHLDTTTIGYYPDGLPEGSSCPQQRGTPQGKPAGTLLQWMLVNSDNVATRSLIDYLGGFAAITQTAQSIGMISTFMDGYPGCSPNRMTQLDAAKLYEALGSGTLLTTASRNALYARTPADGGDSAAARPGGRPSASPTLCDRPSICRGRPRARQGPRCAGRGRG